jgi:selenocysteine lyase/cysteine desulfurase
VDASSGELLVGQYDELLSERTRLVALTAASNLIGTRPDVGEICRKARAVGALSYVDGVHATPHMPVDVVALGADFWATSAYKWSGPHVGAVVASVALLERLHPYELDPAPESVPGRFERGTLAFADLAGVTAAVEHLASLDPAAAGTRRERLIASMTAVAEYETVVFASLLEGLEAMPHVTTYGTASVRAPTACFNLTGRSPREVAAHLGKRGVNVWNGDNYARELAGVLKIRDKGGAVRAGVVHYNDDSDVIRLLEALDELGPAAS